LAPDERERVMKETLWSTILRFALPVLPAGLFCLMGFTPFWGGLLFFLVAELVRWLLTLLYRAPRGFGPLVQLIGILGAPLPTLAILLLAALPSQGREVQGELIDSFTLYVCYIPYAFATLFVFPLLSGDSGPEDPVDLDPEARRNLLRQAGVKGSQGGPVTRPSR
jgi:hypothetical protein